MRDKLTKEEGLAIQAEHVALWAKVLKPEVLEKLKAEVDRRNNESVYQIDDGFDVWRGTNIDEWVHNAARIL